MFKCVNCKWEGEKLSKKIEGAMYDDKCPNCGDEVIGKKKKEELEKSVNLDLNNDGKIDEKDGKIASQVMNTLKNIKKKKKSKKGGKK